MASDYQGETIQVFLFFRGRFLGFQCFAQDRLTIGGAPGMDFPLPECPEEEGYWDVYFSRGSLYAWFRGPKGGKGDDAPEDPRKVQPLDTFSLGDYRIQVKLLDGQGFADLPKRDEAAVAEDPAVPPAEAVLPDEDGGADEVRTGAEGEGQEASRSGEQDQEQGAQELPRTDAAPDEVEGISIDYARSIWAGVDPDATKPASAQSAEAVGAQADPVEHEPDSVGQEGLCEEAANAEEELGVLEELADLGEEGEPFPKDESGAADESVESNSLDYLESLWGLRGEEAAAAEQEEGGETDGDASEAIQKETSGADTGDAWIGFGLQVESFPEETVHHERAECEPVPEEPLGEVSVEGLGPDEGPTREEARFVETEAEANASSGQDLVTLAEEEGRSEGSETADERQEASRTVDLQEQEEGADRVQPAVAGQKEEQVPVEAEAGGLVEGMSREERTRFWDDMAREAFANKDGNGAKTEPEEAILEASLAEETAVQPPATEEPSEATFEGRAVSDEEEEETEEQAEEAEEAQEQEAQEVQEEGEEEGWEEDEEDEEKEDQDITYFSLVKQVFPSRTPDPKATYTGGRALEVVRFRGRDIQDIRYLEGGSAYTIRKGWNRSVWKRRGGVPPNFKLVRIKNGGVAELHVRESVNGRIYSEKGSKDLWELRGGKKGRFSLRGQSSWLPLPADTWALLRVNSGRYLVRYVPPRPKPAVQPLRPNVTMGQFKLVSLSMLSHILLVLVIGLVVPDRTLEGYNRIDQFARIDPEALKALKPPPPPKKPEPVTKEEVKPKPKPKPAPTKASKHPVPKSVQKATPPVQGRSGAAGGGKKEVDVAQTGLLAALGGPNAGVLDGKGNSEILLAAVTNLDAVAVPSDTTTFNLAGVAGKLATSEIQVPTSDVIETVGAAQLIKNGDGTLGVLASKGTGQVKGIVHEPPKAKISIQGGMSREAVLKVVNAHLDEVRDCYERELLHNPGISGKILMEWLIQLDGTVRYAKVKFTNIGHSSDLHSCIEAQVVTWNFPRPKGGQEVLVTFPFLFESMGF